MFNRVGKNRNPILTAIGTARAFFSIKRWRLALSNKFGYFPLWIVASILQPRVRVPSTPSKILSIHIDLCRVEKTKINEKRPGLAHLKNTIVWWPISIFESGFLQCNVFLGDLIMTQLKMATQWAAQNSGSFNLNRICFQ